MSKPSGWPLSHHNLIAVSLGRLSIIFFLAIGGQQSRSQTLGEALNAPDLTWTTGGAAFWQADTITTHDGEAAVNSGTVSLGQSSWIQTTVTGPGAVTFWYKTSTCLDGALLTFSISGVLQMSGSGDQDWQQGNFYVPAGTQTLMWSLNLYCTSPLLQNMVWLDEVALTNLAAPIIITQPTNQIVLAGNDASIMVGVSGTAPFGFQWQQDGTNLIGATSNLLSIADAQPPNAGDYSLVITNQSGAITSQVATITVLPSKPVFTLQPMSQGASQGATVMFSAAVKGSEPFSWQWYSNGVAISGSTSTTLTLTGVAESYYGKYWAVAANAYGSSTSSVATLSFSPVIAWGANSRGETIIPATATNIIAMAGGDLHCLALRADGNVVCWGGNFVGQTQSPVEATNLVSVAAGSTHSLGVRRDGQALLWGIILGGTTNVPLDATNVAEVALGCGAQHALALRNDGTVFDWGGNSSYPYPTYNLTNIPPSATNIISVAAGAFHCLALRADGTLVAWGDNSYGQTRIPASATNVTAISAGWYQNLALRADGRLVTWGNNPAYGGNGPVPADATNIVDFACGGNHSLALRTDGKLFAWGASSKGQIFIPSWASNVVAVAGTSSDSLALIGDGPARLSNPIANRSVLVGGSAYFRAKAVGVWPLSYQWQLYGTNLLSATNQLLIVSNAQLAQTGPYSVVVTNALGTSLSPNAWLTVIPKESFIISQSLQVTNGQTSFVAVGPSGLKWSVQSSSNLFNWVDIRILTNSTGAMLFNESTTNLSQQFYRLRLIP